MKSNMYKHKGSGVHQGAVIPLQIAKIKAAFPALEGKGLKIAVLANSFNNLGGYQADIDSGDLPDTVEVLVEGPSTGEDEGRATMQLIYDIAPQAKLIFRTAVLGMSDFALGIQELVDEGWDVIVDGVGKL